jgi:hypothetical protein
MAASISRNLLIDKQILQFCGLLHANWLKTIARPPMPKNNSGTDGVSVEKFSSLHLCRASGALSGKDLPGKSNSRPVGLAMSVAQIHVIKGATKEGRLAMRLAYETCGLADDPQG